MSNTTQNLSNPHEDYLEDLHSKKLINKLSVPQKDGSVVLSNIALENKKPTVAFNVNNQSVLFQQQRGKSKVTWDVVTNPDTYQTFGIKNTTITSSKFINSASKKLNEELGDIRPFEKSIIKAEKPVAKVTKPVNTMPTPVAPPEKPLPQNTHKGISELLKDKGQKSPVVKTDKSFNEMMHQEGIGISSLDFETTGIDHKINRVTQLGVHSTGASGKTFELERAIIGGVGEVVPDSSAYTKGHKFLDDEARKEKQAWIDENLKDPNHELHYLKNYREEDSVLSHIVTEKDILKAHEEAGAGSFGKEQLERGSFKQLSVDYNSRFTIRENPTKNSVTIGKNTKSNITKGVEGSRAASMVDALTEAREIIKQNKGIILIQNAKFEDTVTEHALMDVKAPGQVLSRDFARDFNSQIYGTDNSKSLFRVSDTVLKSREDFRLASQRVKTRFNSGISFLAQDDEDFKLLKDAALNLHSTIQNEVLDNFKAGESTVVDLMDITKTYQVALMSVLDPETQKPLLETSLIGMGTSVDILAKSFLGQEETHTALSDAEQQSKLFTIINQQIENIRNSDGSAESVKKILEDNKGYIAKMEDPVTHEQQFMKQLTNRVDEVHKKLKEDVSSGKILEEDAEQEFYSRYKTALSETKAYYNGVAERDGFSREIEVQEAEHILSTGERSKETPTFGDISKEVKEAVEVPPIQSATTDAHNNLPGVLANHPANAQGPHQPSPKKAFTREERVSTLLEHLNTKRGAAGAYNSSSESIYRAGVRLDSAMGVKSPGGSALKYGMYALGGMVALNAVAGPPSQEVQQQGTYDALYGDFYLGQSYADWRERNNSHKMMY